MYAADYKNFNVGKTNSKITQAPGGTSSISLSWDDPVQHQPQRKAFDKQRQEQNIQYTTAQKYNDIGSQNTYAERNPTRNIPESQQSYGRKNIYSGGQQQVGGEYGYNNYNPVTVDVNSTKMSYQQQNEAIYGNDYGQGNRYNPIMESQPQGYYKPQSNSTYKGSGQDELDRALQQQKHKVQSSRGQRAHLTQPRTQSNILYHQQTTNNDQKPCVKIHQQKGNDIFGNDYNYWKQDGHLQGNGQRVEKKEKSYHYERNNVMPNYNKGGNDYQNNGDNNRTEKTSVKVHNPPGGRTNFTFG